MAALTLPQKLGRAIARLRAEQRLSQDALAAKVKIHRSYLPRIEKGAYDPRLTTVERLAKGLGMSVSDLLREAER